MKKKKLTPSPKEGNLVQETVDRVVAQLTKKFGKGAAARLDTPGAYVEISRVVSTGLPALDAAIGVGGLPFGRLIEILGPESSGKTTLCKAISAAAQQQGIIPFLIDTEQSGALAYDRGLGLDPSCALASQPSTVQEVFQLIEEAAVEFAKARTPLFVVWDSFAATPLAEEADREYDEMMGARLAERPSFLSKALPKLIGLFKQVETCLVIVNQVRERIGAGPYQKQTYSPGGRAFRHFAHIRIELTPFGRIKVGENVVGVKARATVIKNKVAPPYRSAELEIYFSPPRVVDSSVKPARQPVVL